MDSGSLLAAVAGGGLIGGGAALLLVMNGRIAGISGIVGGIVAPAPGDVAWRALFTAGLVVGGLVALLTMAAPFDTAGVPSLPVVAVAGALVGVGTRIGSGCTSGHGVCGIGRMSPRSLVATFTFMLTGALTVLVTRHLGGAS
jgi:uncharacterized membrane protein YedE/YeeE